MSWSERTCRLHGMKGGCNSRSKRAMKVAGYHAEHITTDGSTPKTLGNVKHIFTGKRFVIRDGKKVEL